MYIRRATQRGKANFGWLNSHHSFSFGSYYDPAHMGVSVLRVINDDIVKGGYGFDTHGHRDMEIISYIVAGAIEHQDSTGNRFIVPAGEVQRMSAGSGIMHSEYNASKTDDLNFLQIWIKPNINGMTPSYEQKRIEQDGKLTPLANPTGDNGALKLHQDATLYRLVLQQGETIPLELPGRIGYLHIIKGDAKTANDSLSAGDGIALNSGERLDLAATSPLEALWFDLPPNVHD